MLVGVGRDDDSHLGRPSDDNKRKKRKGKTVATGKFERLIFYCELHSAYAVERLSLHTLLEGAVPQLKMEIDSIAGVLVEGAHWPEPISTQERVASRR